MCIFPPQPITTSAKKYMFAIDHISGIVILNGSLDYEMFDVYNYLEVAKVRLIYGCVCAKHILRQLFNITLYWGLLKFVINFIGIINSSSLTVVTLSVGGRVRDCASTIHISLVTDFIQQQFSLVHFGCIMHYYYYICYQMYSTSHK